MARFFGFLSTVFYLNCANMFKLSNRHSHTHSKTVFTSMKKDNNTLKLLSNFYKPKSSNQEQYVKYLNDQSTKILFAVGPAGTGKTMLACNHAIKELKSGAVNKIVITRPAVPVENEELGFLPGNINQKMDPWTRPIFDIFYDFYPKKIVNEMLYNNVIEISPLAFMRGRTFKDAYIIADEMQNSSPSQMLMLTTRIGEGSKMIITGDLKQSDKKTGMDSGLSDFLYKYKRYNEHLVKNNIESNIGIKVVEMNNDDIKRHKVILKLLDIYEFNKFEHVISNKPEITQSVNESNKTKITQPLNESKQIKYTDNDAALIPLQHISGRFRE